MNNYNVEEFTMISFDYEIDNRFVTIGGLFGTKHVIFHIDTHEFRKIIKSLQQLDEEKDNKYVK